MIGTGELDLAIVALPVDDDRFEVAPLFTERLLLALPRGHRLARRRAVSFEEARREPFILLDEMHCLGEQVISLCREEGCRRIACRSTQISTLQTLIALGQGLSLLPEMARSAGPAGLVYRPIEGRSPARTLAAVRHPGRCLGEAARLFFETLRAITAGQRPREARPAARPTPPPAAGAVRARRRAAGGIREPERRRRR
jgi:LysR family hydrogen peroxide-inducible transcriptional activator